MENIHVDCAVVGGGIIGCAISYYIAKENKKVVCLEEQQVGGKTTSAAAGMLGAHSEYREFKQLYPFAKKSQLLYEDLYEEIKQLTGIDFEKRGKGLLKLAFSGKDLEELETILPLESVEWQTAEEVYNMVPSISSEIIGAAYLKEDVHITPQIACKAFSKGAEMHGGVIYEYCSVWDIQKEGEHYILTTSKGNVLADQVIIASGVWSNRFFKESGLTNRIIPVKGECIAAINTQMPLHVSLFYDQYYIVPRNNRELIIGATKKWDDWSEQPTLAGIETVIQKARKMVPTISSLPIVRCWAGLRPQTFDGKPFIGEHPERKNLFFATGHQRNGILLAPITGKMIADLVMGYPVKKDWIEAFKIERSLNVHVGG